MWKIPDYPGSKAASSSSFSMLLSCTIGRWHNRKIYMTRPLTFLAQIRPTITIRYPRGTPIKHRKSDIGPQEESEMQSSSRLIWLGWGRGQQHFKSGQVSPRRAEILLNVLVVLVIPNEWTIPIWKLFWKGLKISGRTISVSSSEGPARASIRLHNAMFLLYLLRDCHECKSEYFLFWWLISFCLVQPTWKKWLRCTF